jgi:undecaprenyl diphosphate synthase
MAMNGIVDEQVQARPRKLPEGADAAMQDALRGRGPLPTHIAIIMDGNGRWARERGKERVSGHHEGAASVRDVTEACAQLGIPFLTLYTFSTENWYRPVLEVDALMHLLIRTLQRERATLLENDIRLRAIGDLTKLPRACKGELDETVRATANNQRMTLSLALSYSGRWEITRAARILAERVARGELTPEQIDETLFSECLGSAGMPDPDLLIRTGGEHRISNFLLWQLAYTEMYITDRYWPAFRRDQLYDAIASFQDRERRFGRVPGES